MRNIFRVPRFFIPRKEYSDWCVIAGNRYCNEAGYWAQFASRSTPSAYQYFIPEARMKSLHEGYTGELHEEMYAALECEYFEKLVRGFVMSERVGKHGVRYGLVAAFDLDAFSCNRQEEALVRPMQDFDEGLVQKYFEQRRGAPIELTHVIVAYQDSKDKITKALLKEELEEIYSYSVEGGALKGYFVPEELAYEAADVMQSKAEPAFMVLEGVDVVVAAKRYWEELKPKLSQEERRSHPARYLMAEFVNLYDEGLELRYAHRLVKDVSPAEFEGVAAEWKAQGVAFEKKDGLYVVTASSQESVQKAAEVLQRCPEVVSILGEARLKKFAAEENGVGVVFRGLEKEQLIKALKAGKTYPHRSFCVGGLHGGRYYVEAREISYD